MRLLAAAVLIATTATAGAASVEGEWVTEGDKARVEIKPCATDAQTLCGTITWSYRPADQPSGPLLDIHNGDANLRSRPIVGLPLLEGFKPAGADAWDGGTIYDPEGGKTYKSKFRLKDANTLEVDGCVLFLCQTQTWVRWKG